MTVQHFNEKLFCQEIDRWRTVVFQPPSSPVWVSEDVIGYRQCVHRWHKHRLDPHWPTSVGEVHSLSLFSTYPATTARRNAPHHVNDWRNHLQPVQHHADASAASATLPSTPGTPASTSAMAFLGRALIPAASSDQRQPVGLLCVHLSSTH